jgi:hypothetical protein
MNRSETSWGCAFIVMSAIALFWLGFMVWGGVKLISILENYLAK